MGAAKSFHYKTLKGQIVSDEVPTPPRAFLHIAENRIYNLQTSRNVHLNKHEDNARSSKSTRHAYSRLEVTLRQR
jgi:hypothetical protein